MDFLRKLFELQDEILAGTREALGEAEPDELSAAARDEEGDTIYGIDLPGEEALLGFCERWGETASFLLVAEGIEPEGRRFGSGAPAFRLIVDPVDGSRGLMHDKRSAWSLAAVATEHGEDTRMEHVVAASMTELPTTRQGKIDRIFATRNSGGGAEPTRSYRTDLYTGEVRPNRIAPSTANSLHNGFGTVVDYFPGGKDILGGLAEQILTEEMGGWDPDKANVFSDQYISSAGQLAEIILGRDRFVLDVRPLVYRALDAESSLCARPYDLCTMLAAEQAGVVVQQPDGSPLNPPLDITSNLAFVAYANPRLAARLQPIVLRALKEFELL